eukprot:359130-Chlamydomonas_euryale.AAC.2
MPEFPPGGSSRTAAQRGPAPTSGARRAAGRSATAPRASVAPGNGNQPVSPPAPPSMTSAEQSVPAPRHDDMTTNTSYSTSHTVRAMRADEPSGSGAPCSNTAASSDALATTSTDPTFQAAPPPPPPPGAGAADSVMARSTPTSTEATWKLIAAPRRCQRQGRRVAVGAVQHQRRGQRRSATASKRRRRHSDGVAGVVRSRRQLDEALPAVDVPSRVEHGCCAGRCVPHVDAADVTVHVVAVLVAEPKADGLDLADVLALGGGRGRVKEWTGRKGGPCAESDQAGWSFFQMAKMGKIRMQGVAAGGSGWLEGSAP